jgi:glutamine amidotransferase
MKIAIIDYGAGNLSSAKNAVLRCIEEMGISAEVLVTAHAEDLNSADHIILPGVGAYKDCIENLRATTGMVEAMEENILRRAKPFLGICVGMQLLATQGHEHGIHQGLDWIAGDIVALDPALGIKVPHMGWNDLDIKSDHLLFEGIETGADVYFVHSYHFELADESHLLASVNYGSDITAVIGRDNIIGTQFHPEKSQKYGLKFIENFLKWRP